MSRAERLLELIQILRRYRRPVSGEKLSAELGVSIRSLYRDVATLRAQGATIEGEPGLGYMLRPGFMLPPLMFSEDEIEALVLGSRWVAERADGHLALAARNALTKIVAVLPSDLRDEAAASSLLVGPSENLARKDQDITTIRKAIRAEHKLLIAYEDAKAVATQRVIWPIALAFFDHCRVVAAWCETRRDFRHFRTDRIKMIEALELRYTRRRAVLLKEWRALEGIPEQ
ncbi:MAG: YafY family transcriptional regulator [Hyphomicrobiales bacterium]|nr:YafY family transcriptional regulator [Hyphomicrobiales bacterium]MDE2115078.1 YafY family transcriptional regulator [Hyphomicrobiales bacterium]